MKTKQDGYEICYICHQEGPYTEHHVRPPAAYVIYVCPECHAALHGLLNEELWFNKTGSELRELLEPYFQYKQRMKERQPNAESFWGSRLIWYKFLKDSLHGKYQDLPLPDAYTTEYFDDSP